MLAQEHDVVESDANRSPRLLLPPWAGPLVGLIAVYLLFMLIVQVHPDGALGSFVSMRNTKTILNHTVIVGIGALGMTMVIISGSMDLSVGSLIALTTVVTARVLRDGGGDPATLAFPLLAAGAGALAAMACGLVNGALVSRLRIVPFIATLGMMRVARGLAKSFANSQTVETPKTWLNDLMVIEPSTAWYSVAPGVWLLLALLLVVHVILRYTVLGRYIYAIGSNEATARLCGVRTRAYKTLIFGICGLLTGIAGVMQFSRLTLGNPTAAEGMELRIIAAVVIGGSSLNGGEGTAFGTLVGALIMTVLASGCTNIGIPNWAQDVIIGAVIIGAAAIDVLKHRLRT